MSGGSRVRYGRGVRERAADLFETGRGHMSVARILGVPVKAVRRWQQRYQAVGREALLDMGETPRKYDFETRVAAARAVVEDGMAKPDAMREFGIANMTSLDNWCRLYRREGAEALRPKRRGRPRESGEKLATREEELEREVRRLEAKVAYLEKSMALKAARDCARGNAR